MFRYPFRRAHTRALLISSFCLSVVALASLWASTPQAKNQFNHATYRAVSTGRFLPDKGAIIPAATITVNSLSDVANSNDGLCTLREAITAANNNSASGAVAGECSAGSPGSDTIDLTGVSGAIVLTSALPDIVGNNIQGPGASVLTVRRSALSGTPNFRIFVTSGLVSISGLAIREGRAADGVAGGGSGSGSGSQGGSGGGILNNGTLSLQDVVVSGNRTGDGGLGSTGGGGFGGYGGGIYSSGNLTLTNVTISNNLTGNGATGSNGGEGGKGGGIFTTFGSGITRLTNCVVSGNVTGQGIDGNGGSKIGSSAGGGGGLFIEGGTVTMTGVEISNNTTGSPIVTAADHHADGGSGGGVFASTNSTLSIVNSTIKGNRTGDGVGPLGVAGGTGGLLNAFGTLTVSGSTISGNSTGNGAPASLGGGLSSNGPTVLINTTISGNIGSSTGNGVGLGDSSITLTNCTVTGNAGKGISVFGSMSPTIRNSIIAGNGTASESDVSGSFNSLGHNLVGKFDGSSGFSNGSNGDQIGTVASPLNPQLGPLSNNGGPTLTHALLSNSPALDAGDNCVTQVTHCSDSKIPQLIADQRGFNRLVDGPDADTTTTVDIGAYETQSLLANLSDASTNEDTQLLVAFEPGDLGTITSINAISSNTILVPNDSGHLSAALVGVTEVVTINPAANLFGTTNITITVNRTGGSENKTFLLSVVPVNEAPSFTKGADQTVNEDAGAQTVNGWATNISSGPGEESGQALTFQVTNNTNAALFSAGPAISSTGTLTYTTAANANGSATITINLKDDGGTANSGGDTSATQAFTITVNSVNDAPTFTKGADQTVNNNAGAQSVANWATNLSRGAADEFGQALTFQITANSNPGLFATPPAVNSSGTLSYSPLTTAGGTATITVVLKDSGGTSNGGVDTSAAQSFNITVSPTGGFINFSAANYDTTESSGFATLTVKRTGDLTRAVNVDYASSGDNGLPCSTPSATATPKCDFTTALGTLSFAAGEDTKTVNILISQDSFVEGPETFFLNLSNQTGGSALASPSTATNTIADDVTEPPTNLIDDVRNFVRQHYHDFLNREPDASGWDFWSNQITSCGSDAQCAEVRRIDVSASFFLSIEFQQSGYLVERFYKVAYGNAQGNSTFNGQHQLAVPAVRFNEFLKDTQRVGRGVVVLAPGWEQALENNKLAYALEFVQTTRFIAAFPTSRTPAQFVDQLNQNAGNVLSASERTTAINLFSGAGNTSNNTARAQAVRQVAEDVDLYSAEYNRAFVLAQYFGYLRRNPNDAPDSDYTGYDFWLTKLNQFNGSYINAEMVKAFLSSIEYRQRFGP